MKRSQALSVVALVLLWSGSAMAQDAVKVDPAHYKLVMENASVRILRISYAPGATSITHQHPDSIVIPLSASKVRFTLPDKTAQDSDLANDWGTCAVGETGCGHLRFANGTLTELGYSFFRAVDDHDPHWAEELLDKIAAHCAALPKEETE